MAVLEHDGGQRAVRPRGGQPGEGPHWWSRATSPPISPYLPISRAWRGGPHWWSRATSPEIPSRLRICPWTCEFSLSRHRLLKLAEDKAQPLGSISAHTSAQRRTEGRGTLRRSCRLTARTPSPSHARRQGAWQALRDTSETLPRPLRGPSETLPRHSRLSRRGLGGGDGGGGDGGGGGGGGPKPRGGGGTAALDAPSMCGMMCRVCTLYSHSTAAY